MEESISEADEEEDLQYRQSSPDAAHSVPTRRVTGNSSSSTPRSGSILRRSVSSLKEVFARKSASLLERLGDRIDGVAGSSKQGKQQPNPYRIGKDRWRWVVDRGTLSLLQPGEAHVSAPFEFKESTFRLELFPISTEAPNGDLMAGIFLVADPERTRKRWECTLDQSVCIYRSNEPRQASEASTTVRYCYYQQTPSGSGSGAVDWAGRAKKGPVSALRWGFPGICPTALLVSRPTAESSAQAAPIYVDIALKLAGQMITRA